MTIIRIAKNSENPFVMMDKRPINDDRLSWKAKGLLAYFLSKPNDWQIWVNDLIKRAKDGEAAVRSGLKELTDVGYLRREQKQRQDGTFLSMEYMVYEVPLGDFPQADNPQADNPHVENQVHTKNDLTENELTEKEENPPAKKTPLIGGTLELTTEPQPNTKTPPEPPTVPVLTLGRSPKPPQVTEPATPGDQPNSDTITDAKDTLYSAVAPGDHPDDNIVRAQAVPGITAFEGFVPASLDALPEISVTVGYPESLSESPSVTDPVTSGDQPDRAVPAEPPADPKRNYLTDLLAYAKRQQPGDSDTHIRPKHWETVSDDEYAVCERVAQLWCVGKLPFPGSIEVHCGAAGWLLHELCGGNLSACVRALDEYHEHYEAERMSFTVAGPKSLVAVLPAFLAQVGGAGGEAGVIRVGG